MTLRPLARAASSGPCQTTLALINGNPVEISCGPATAKLRYKGKTYSFKNGTCRKSDIGGTGGGTLTLGKNVDAKDNAGFTGMTIAFFGRIGTDNATVVAKQGNLYLDAGYATASKYGATGTIKGTGGGSSFTVAWNCGGAPSPE